MVAICHVPPERVLDVDVDLRAVEGAVARVQLVGEPVGAQRLVERVLRRVPLLAPCRALSGGRVASLNDGSRSNGLVPLAHQLEQRP